MRNASTVLFGKLRIDRLADLFIDENINKIDIKESIKYNEFSDE
jgi:hypothetical protein